MQKAVLIGVIAAMIYLYAVQVNPINMIYGLAVLLLIGIVALFISDMKNKNTEQ